MEKLAITIFPKPPKLKELLSACRLIASQTLEKTGCMDCRVSSSGVDDSAIQFEQYWRQRHHLDDYFRSDHFNALMGAMKLLAIDFEVAINDGSPSEGSLFIDRARNKE